MKDIIYHYYNLKINTITKNNNNYYFYYNNNLYYLYLYNNNLNIINNIYKLSLSIIPNITHNIIINKDNSIITIIDNKPYILLKINTNIKNKISINELNNFKKLYYIPDNKLTRGNWNILWSNKIDYIETQINEIKTKYPILTNSIDYFIGLTENAISYYQNTIDNYQISNNYSLSHNKITNNNFNFYNPLNIIIDHEPRDLAEYIKLSFYLNNKSILKEILFYIKNNNYNNYDICILISRLLYPSIYLDTYDNIINNTIDEKQILPIINNVDNYETYLKNILSILEKYYIFPNIEWLQQNKKE